MEHRPIVKALMTREVIYNAKGEVEGINYHGMYEEELMSIWNKNAPFYILITNAF